VERRELLGPDGVSVATYVRAEERDGGPCATELVPSPDVGPDAVARAAAEQLAGILVSTEVPALQEALVGAGAQVRRRVELMSVSLDPEKAGPGVEPPHRPSRAPAGVTIRAFDGIVPPELGAVSLAAYPPSHPDHPVSDAAAAALAQLRRFVEGGPGWTPLEAARLAVRDEDGQAVGAAIIAGFAGALPQPRLCALRALGHRSDAGRAAIGPVRAPPPDRPLAFPPVPPASEPRRTAKKLPGTLPEPQVGETLIWTDGACQGNPGPGGWAAILVDDRGNVIDERSGGSPQTTNNIMEMTAALEGMRALPAGSAVVVVTDSRYLLDGMTSWMAGWKKRGWKTAGGDPVKNKQLWLDLEEETQRHAAVRWHWVPGHVGIALNDRADELAVAAAAAAG
jgi:ribonuclease HI